MIPQKGKKVTLGQLGAFFTGGAGGGNGRKKSVVQAGSSSSINVDHDKCKKKKGSVNSTPNLQNIDRPPQKSVLWNEDIAKLSIKNHPWQKQQGILVKRKPKKNSKNYSIKKLKAKTQEVLVSYPAENSVPCKPYLGRSNPCIRFDKDVHIVPHCILGTEDEFIEQNNREGKLIQQKEKDISDYAVSSESSRSDTSQIPQSAYNAHVDEMRALKAHKQTLMDRKLIRQRLAEFTNRRERDLVMSDDFRQCEVGSKVLLNHGKLNYWDIEKTDSRCTGYWKLMVTTAPKHGVLHSTLTQAEQGFPLPRQFIGFPQCTVKERVLGRSKKIPLVYSIPDTLKLYMKGKASNGGICVTPGYESLFQDEDGVTTSTLREMEFWNKQLYINPDGTWKSFSPTNDEDSPSKIPVITITGSATNCPRIKLCGREAKWYPKNVTRENVNAEAGKMGPMNEILYFNVTLDNCGSTVVFYDWQRKIKESPFGILRKPRQRFYFNDKEGVLLPGITRTIPCMFKSPTTGSFSEQWKLVTKPNLCGQGEIILTLWGLATSDDVAAGDRKSIEDHLSEKIKETAISFDIETILARIRTPGGHIKEPMIRPSGSDLFQYNNKLSYNSVQVHDLLQLGYILDPSHKFTPWNISVDRLNKLIRRKELVDDLVNEDDPENHITEFGQNSLLKELNSIISKLSFPSLVPTLDMRYNICCGLLKESIDKFVDVSEKLKNIYGVKIEKIIECKESVHEPTLLKKLPKESKEKKGSVNNKNEKHGNKGSNKTQATEKLHIPVAPPPHISEIIYILKEDPEIYSKYCDKLYISCQALLVELADNIERRFSGLK